MYTILGTGISSLCLAQILIRRGVPGEKITIIDSSENPGGLFGFLQHDENTIFDIGMHTIQLTGDKAIDEILLEVMNSEEWCKYEPPQHDLAGVILGEKLFDDGPYFNLNYFEKTVEDRLSKKLRGHLEKTEIKKKLHVDNLQNQNLNNAQEYLESKFGFEVSKLTYEQALHYRYGIDANQLDCIATKLTPMDRICATTEFEDQELLKNEHLRKNVAWSNQRHLPVDLSSGKPVFYPKKRAINLIIQRLLEKLKYQKVNFEFNTKIDHIECQLNRIKKIHISSSGQSKKIEVSKLFWTGGVGNLLEKLGTYNTLERIQNPMKTTIVTMRVNRKYIHKSDCMYYFNYMNKTGLYRLNNYDGYSGIEKDDTAAKVSLEYVTLKNKILTKEAVITHLEKIHFLDSKIRDISIRIHELPNGHPFPSKVNTNNEQKQIDFLNEMKMENLSCFGTSISSKRFFKKMF